MIEKKESLNQPILSIAGKKPITLHEYFTIQQALDNIRLCEVSERIVYFYVIDNEDRLVGVLPTRRLLTSDLDKQLSEVMITQVMTIPQHATILDACELFVTHKFLAFPVVDEQQHIIGVVDVSELTNEVLNLEEKEQMNKIFETIGFRVSDMKVDSPFQSFAFRFPWLITTICSGTMCALLASVYEATLAKTLILSFFLTLVLGLGESVSMQSMTLTIYSLSSVHPTFKWYFKAFFRESGSALLLGTACGLIVGLIVWLWRGALSEAVSIGASILLVLLTACFLGLSIPAFLHVLKFDLKIAAGPLTLAVTDIFTILFYLTLATLLL